MPVLMIKIFLGYKILEFNPYRLLF